MDTIVGSSVARPRLYASLGGLFAVVGALLAAIGLYGVLSFVVQERAAEVGVRLALGATRSDILRMVAREGGALVAVGLVAGSAGALALARAVETLLYGVAPSDPRVFVAAAVLFAAVASVDHRRAGATRDAGRSVAGDSLRVAQAVAHRNAGLRGWKSHPRGDFRYKTGTAQPL